MFLFKTGIAGAESRARVVLLACMKPKDLGYPHEMWTQRLLAEHIRENCICLLYTSDAADE